MAIKALGFDPEPMPEELVLTRWGTVKADFRTQMTSIPGVFAAGDIVRGASLVVWAIRDGRDRRRGDARLHGRRRRRPDRGGVSAMTHLQRPSSPGPVPRTQKHRGRWHV